MYIKIKSNVKYENLLNFKSYLEKNFSDVQLYGYMIYLAGNHVIESNNLIEAIYEDDDFPLTSRALNVDKVFESDELLIIAGPCAVEDLENYLKTAKVLLENGINLIRAGVYKPRTSPYSFQGLGDEGLEFLKVLKENSELILVGEVMSQEQLEKSEGIFDILQIGTRNMQNFELLKAVGADGRPVILKRGMSSKISEFLNAAEYIISHGNDQVILCERGIRTFEDAYRNILDINSISYLKQQTWLPVIADISHATGDKRLIADVAKAAVAAGADGLMIETQISAEDAVSDSEQTMELDDFLELFEKVKEIQKIK